ncbi:MAG TPA: response regulator [Elusimicrobia bacterium]|jgi:excisionase family DNA binding protein|nr:response regulator [Elusimicrobiota bacterium]
MEKAVYTTYDISKICNVDLTTVIGWIEKGILPGYRTPGGHRRVKKEDLIEFLKKYQLPLPVEWASGEKKKILIIDDEPKILSYCLRALKKLKFESEIETADDGFSGGRKISTFLPDLVILDLRLPGVDGFELCREIRSDERLKKTRILAITAYDSPETKERIIANGADAYLGKPFDISDLMKSVENLLGHSQPG